MSNRIYLVTDHDTQAKRLIRAVSQAQAIRHAVQGRFEATVASQDDLLGLLAAGQAVESAESAAPQASEAEPQAAPDRRADTPERRGPPSKPAGPTDHMGWKAEVCVPQRASLGVDPARS